MATVQMPVYLALFVTIPLGAQSRVDETRAASAKLNTDQRIASCSQALAAQPQSAHLENLLARAYIQKMRRPSISAT